MINFIQTFRVWKSFDLNSFKAKIDFTKRLKGIRGPHRPTRSRTSPYLNTFAFKAAATAKNFVLSFPKIVTKYCSRRNNLPIFMEVFIPFQGFQINFIFLQLTVLTNFNQTPINMSFDGENGVNDYTLKVRKKLFNFNFIIWNYWKINSHLR